SPRAKRCASASPERAKANTRRPCQRALSAAARFLPLDLVGLLGQRGPHLLGQVRDGPLAPRRRRRLADVRARRRPLLQSRHATSWRGDRHGGLPGEARVQTKRRPIVFFPRPRKQAWELESSLYLEFEHAAG